MKYISEYKKYKWFYTYSGKLVVGGKNAEQNDILLRKMQLLGDDFIVMHTEVPGSPFSVILDDKKNITKRDIEECAIFTACFSKAWKLGKSNAIVHLFNSSQLRKSKGMNEGTWAVSGNVKKISVPLVLVLTKQDSVLRAVPEKSVIKKEDAIIKICPGKIQKNEFVAKLATELSINLNQSELLSALPAGGINICRNNKK